MHRLRLRYSNMATGVKVLLLQFLMLWNCWVCFCTHVTHGHQARWQLMTHRTIYGEKSKD